MFRSLESQMRYSICTICGGTIIEDDSNPNVHYSNPDTICWRCKLLTEKDDLK